MGLRQIAKALLWFGSAPLVRWKYLDRPAFRKAATGLHRSAQLMGNGRFDFSQTFVVGRRSRLEAQGQGRLSLAAGARIGDDCELSTTGTLSIGAHASLQNRSTILGDVSIGAGCVCAPNLYVSSGWHHFEDHAPLPIRWQDAHAQAHATAARSRPVRVGEDCWLGINVVLAPGVSVGRGCVVGANSVVTRDLPPYAVAVGAPAKVIRQRLAFVPPRALQAGQPEHIPYFYSGFDFWSKEATTPEAALQSGGWLAGPQFSIALDVVTAATVFLDLHSQVSGELRHAQSVVRVAPGTSRVSFAAQPSASGLLEFDWSGQAGAGISIIAVQQNSD